MHKTLISVAQAAELVAGGQARVFDCSFVLTDPDAGRAQYEAAHVPGAHYLHLDNDLAGPMDGTNGRHPLPDPDVLAAKLREAGLNGGQQVIAYDSAGGPFAARLWWLLRWLGHEQVAVMDGNIGDWQAAGHPVEQGPPIAGEPGDFVPGRIGHDQVVDAAMVLDNIPKAQALVLDARAAPRFRGEVLVMDAVAGHIPGARNRPFSDNLGADGRFKPSDVLRREFASAIDGYAPEDVVLQCGSGVTACHNALAMQHAGLKGARLYPGSWSEWASDPARPVELGDPSAAAAK